MYRIIDDKFELGIKIHYAATLKLANAIKDDLDNRFNTGMIVDATDNKTFTYDPGGPLIMGDENLDFNLGDLVLRCKAQHFNNLVYVLSTDRYLNPRKSNGVEYYKIHGAWWSICLTPDELNSLKSQVNNTKLAMRADDILNKKNDVLEALQSEGVYNSVIEKDDGKIHKCIFPDKKKLN